MHFTHTLAIWRTFPEPVAGAIDADGIHDHAAVQPSVEGMQDTAAREVPELLGVLEREIAALWAARVRSAMLTRQAPRFEVAG